uniref:Uncharacterized protein n=1 Tax=Magallana gigas TaxID=29159 RepID=A0A8W8NWS1_MAGGI
MLLNFPPGAPSTAASQSDSESEGGPTDETPQNNPTQKIVQTRRLTTTYPDGRTEISRNSQIIYSEDVDPEDVDFRSVVSEIAEDVAECLRKGNVREMKGDFSRKY